MQNQPENKTSLNPAFNKYAGKIINMAELNALQYSSGFKGFTEKLADALGGVAELAKIPFSPKSGSAQYEDVPQVYVTAGANAFQPQMGRDVYFEASTAMSFMDAALGKAALTKSFVAAVEKAPDHSGKLATGGLTLAEKNSFTATMTRMGFAA
ncbi:MAG: hypothetical protein PW788_06505 [Micavibrio sp.]|nr:hypothetical protein [Micavibrio sp.]